MPHIRYELARGLVESFDVESVALCIPEIQRADRLHEIAKLVTSDTRSLDTLVRYV